MKRFFILCLRTTAAGPKLSYRASPAATVRICRACRPRWSPLRTGPNTPMRHHASRGHCPAAPAAARALARRVSTALSARCASPSCPRPPLLAPRLRQMRIAVVPEATATHCAAAPRRAAETRADTVTPPRRMPPMGAHAAPSTPPMAPAATSKGNSTRLTNPFLFSPQAARAQFGPSRPTKEFRWVTFETFRSCGKTRLQNQPKGLFVPL